MRTRSRSRRNALDPPAMATHYHDSPSILRDPPRSLRRRTSTPSSSAIPTAPPTDLSPTFRSDIVLRNIGILAFAAAIALTFLNIFLYTAIFSVGLLAPAWQTFKSLEARNSIEQQEVDIVEVRSDSDTEDEDYVPPGVLREQRVATSNAASNAQVMVRNWQTYWVMAAMLFAADGLFLRPLIAPFLPASLYSVGLFSTVTWLTRNRGGNAHALYTAVVRPMFIRSEKVIDRVVEKGMSKIDAITQHAVVQVNEVVAPYARQLEHAAAVTSQQIQDGRFTREFRRGRFLR